jgi:hypothetical protein
MSGLCDAKNWDDARLQESGNTCIHTLYISILFERVVRISQQKTNGEEATHCLRLQSMHSVNKTGPRNLPPPFVHTPHFPDPRDKAPHAHHRKFPDKLKDNGLVV